MNRFVAGLKTAIVLSGLISILVLSGCGSESQSQPEPTAVAVLPTQEVVEVTAEPTLSPEEVRYHMQVVRDFVSKVDWCKSGYILGTISNVEGSTRDALAYIYEQSSGRQPDNDPLVARRNIQKAITAGTVVCITVIPTIATLFEQLGDTSVSTQQ